MELTKAIGFPAPQDAYGTSTTAPRRRASDQRPLLQYVNLQLLATGLPCDTRRLDARFEAMAADVLQSHREQGRLLAEHRCPVDRRIEQFLAEHFAELKLDRPLRLPGRTLVLGRHGVARELSLPVDGDHYKSPLLDSYRVRNGVLHNPKSDRRTTAGTFHVAEGGLPIAADKRVVPKAVFAELFRRAAVPPDDLAIIPFTAALPTPARSFVSLLLRPMVCPEVPGVCPRKTMEVRFFAPGTLVSNLDFVESIFGNAGDPFLPENDAALDVEHWSGHTGCVILAPHLVEVTKKDLGLPHVDKATPRQKRDRMCWASPDEKYNDGVAFKATCRTDAGVIVTLIADSYYGYCKKEVKTQVSYAANLYGNVEEEHAGGALVFPSYSMGEEFVPDSRSRGNGRTWADVVRDHGPMMDVMAEGYGVDREHPAIVYVPETAHASVSRQQVFWTTGGGGGAEQAIPLLPGKVYVTPSGYRLHIEKHPGAPSWRVVGTVGEGTFCHKPSTVSGGGKSEISKPIRDYMLYGPIFVSDVKKDLYWVEQIFRKDFSSRWKSESVERPDYSARRSRSILSPARTLGSVIKLLTPSTEYTDTFNAWLASIPDHVYPIVFIIKRFHRPEWGEDWRSHFSVDIVNGYPGHELKYGGRKLVGTYLRVGLIEGDGAGGEAWRTFKVRQDFIAAAKIQTEDDITASVVVPTKQLQNLNPAYAPQVAVKFAANCEYRLFQRPDDAVHRGLDKLTEHDFGAKTDNFISNFEPLTAATAADMVRRIAEFDTFTPPMQAMLKGAAEAGAGYVVSSAHPRIVDGKPTKNPRYLQDRPDLVDPLSAVAADRGMRLARGVPAGQPVYAPVNAVLVGRRNNPPEPNAKIRGLAVYNPVHYQELPELFMDFVCSLTGKSPSTTGAGSEGALTKSPFNALRPTADLNAALVSYALTGLAVFSTSAGHVGPHVRVDHDLSLLIPEVWARLNPEERDPRHLIGHGMLEPLRDFDHAGETILASRLGYRITAKFVQTYFGRVFDNPSKVFDDAILKPETQDQAAFVDGIKNITEAQQRVAAHYFDDGSIEEACEPLRALLHIMAHGQYHSRDAHHPDVRRLFTRESVLASDWYRQRLATKQARDVALWQRHIAYVEQFQARPSHRDEAARLDVEGRRRLAAAELARVRSPQYLDALVGTIGAQPF
ncbi:MAG TPA: hypothetical protein VK324_04850 [Tepidisphaeraceae bacterium]|nr:hypothetical protein [Tepidisphaeraceae bacterium]